MHNSSMLPTNPLFTLTLAKTQNLILFSLLSLHETIFKSPNFPLSSLDCIDLVFLLVCSIWTLAINYYLLTLVKPSYRKRNNKPLYQSFSQLFQTIYILFIFFSQNLAPYIQKVFMLIIFLIWISCYFNLVEKNQSPLFFKYHLKISSSEANIELFSLTNLALLSLMQFLGIDNKIILSVLLLFNQLGVFFFTTIIPLVNFLYRKITSRKNTRNL